MVKGSIITSARQKKENFDGILLLENMPWRIWGITANLSTLWLVWACTSITPSLALYMAVSWTPWLYAIPGMSLISKKS
jgi:hypothetical protein